MRLHFFNSAVITNSKMDYRPYPSSPGPLFQNDGRCSAFDIEIIFHSHANKTHFHKKGCAPSLILKGRVFGTRKWPITWTLRELGPNALISNNITLPTVKTTLAYIKRNHFLVHHRSPTSRSASDSYQQGTSQAYDI